ncbi:hypothetical protein WJ542_14260 [Paraburkholderia sp. B3]|uniref:hypothetical protein n=1 Tax=Paraburkholderia sp. B3 TaxID=3134791 RepID=UPI003981F42C
MLTAFTWRTTSCASARLCHQQEEIFVAVDTKRLHRQTVVDAAEREIEQGAEVLVAARLRRLECLDEIAKLGIKQRINGRVRLRRENLGERLRSSRSTDPVKLTVSAMVSAVRKHAPIHIIMCIGARIMSQILSRVCARVAGYFSPCHPKTGSRLRPTQHGHLESGQGVENWIATCPGFRSQPSQRH